MHAWNAVNAILRCAHNLACRSTRNKTGASQQQRPSTPAVIPIQDHFILAAQLVMYLAQPAGHSHALYPMYKHPPLHITHASPPPSALAHHVAGNRMTHATCYLMHHAL
mmetsp:Transcript_14430/g.31251  ORF Transcript_14430/g.31251 Transcript_14430/m.31251 type:complete len:109 (-) Transcript_14430:140-466(-)